MEVLRPMAALPFEPVMKADTDDDLHCLMLQDAINTDSMVSIRLSDPHVLPESLSIQELNTKNKQDIQACPVNARLGAAALAKADSLIYDDEDVTLHGLLNTQTSHPPRSPSTSTIDSVTTQGSASEHGSSFLHIRTGSMDSSSSGESAHVDWEELDKNEKEEQKDECSDDSTAFLLARLEKENNALAINPKAAINRTRQRSNTRPPSYQQLRKLVNEPTRPSLRYSLLPSPPPMTELEFWSALVSNYSQTAQRLPTLTSNKIRGGVPPPLRGVVWISIAGARDPFLEDEYDRLCGESSPYEKLIGKDIGRSFPGVDMFRDPNGDGQKMLGKVLNAFSLWDQEIGYCQGLGFVVGPLLMHMGDKEAFCVLVRLMEHYDLRSCFMPDLSGLHLRIFQFQHLLSQDLPQLSKHLDDLKLEPLYLSQWFLSFFGVTCPLPMLLRIYDVILTEGASETLMRVALSLMRRNEKKILATTEFGDIMQLLLSRAMWDTYGCNADDLIADFCGLTGLVTREALQSLETQFKDAHNDDSSSSITRKPSVHSAASRFLGRFWAGSSPDSKSSNNTSLSLSAPSRPASFLRRTPSKQSMASTLNSVEGSDSNSSAASTEATDMSREVSAEWVPQKPIVGPSSNLAKSRVTPAANDDRSLHSQIEDLLTALSDMQRDQNTLVGELQKEREEREEDRAVVQRFIEKMTKGNTLSAIPEDRAEQASSETDVLDILSDVTDNIAALEGRFTVTLKKRSSISQTKHQLHEDVTRLKEQHREEASRSANLTQQLSEQKREAAQLKDELREARSRIQDGYRDKQRLEKAVQDFRNRKSVIYDNYPESPSSASSEYFATGGLRELRLGKPAQSPTSLSTPTFSKRSSSLSTQAVLATVDHKPAQEDALLLDLVNAKTAEAVARQELEEVKGKLDSLRKLLGGGPASPGTAGGHKASPSSPSVSFSASARALQEAPKLVAPTAPSAGGFFSGWGRRSASTSGPSAAAP